MKIEFAPLNIPLRRRLQTAAVLQWTFSFLALAQCCLAVFILLALSDWWTVALLYACWLWLDWDTPTCGGRRSGWVRSWTIWDYFRDYFPIRLIKTADLDPKKNYIFGFHPHGVLVAGAFGNFCTESTGFSRLFPGLRSHLLMLPFWFRVPLFREYIMCGGLVSSSKSSLSYLVSRPEGGNVAVLAVGGAPEALDARPGALTLQVQNRKGFIKLALKHGAQLVPVFSFGENELFDQMENPAGSPLRTLQNRLQSIMGVAMPLFHARGVFQYNFGLMPYRTSIHTVVGKPISVTQTPSPSSEDINTLHDVYLQGLSDLFEQHKCAYGLRDDQHLTFK
ncbi:putative 2-acylglycerol O-acyltransferase 1-like [Scophthalmus maximus]|uniref:Acyltransferase n=1 Tax=Scophthalmus maximus TaxID=52904 RepID=A0A2U9B0H1_SCOMX|nr:2-acylglycerol O-acyltransferase 2-A [Scophthalmus maximus]AWO97413.1 putative 2-acylglycerol O-acyltransferase 1-like [Scophthalmus maximus]